MSPGVIDEDRTRVSSSTNCHSTIELRPPFIIVIQIGVEPITYRLEICRSNHWATGPIISIYTGSRPFLLLYKSVRITFRNMARNYYTNVPWARLELAPPFRRKGLRAKCSTSSLKSLVSTIPPPRHGCRECGIRTHGPTYLVDQTLSKRSSSSTRATL